MSDPLTRVAVLGASGYSGGELLRLLLGHPEARVTYLGVRDSAERTLAGIQPHLAGAIDVPLGDIDPGRVLERADFVFLALPHGVSSAVVPELAEAGARVVDLAGDFRLDAAAYPQWYGFDHPSPRWLEKAVYGLPELFADRIAPASLVANPGCYPTPVVLGLAPLLRAGLIEGARIAVDGKSGLSGAGRSVTEPMMFSTAHESVRPYRFPGHQHTPEMERALGLAMRGAGTPAPRITFVPHLVPAVRGTLCTAYAVLSKDDITSEQLTACLAEAYARAPFVRVLPVGEMCDTKRVRGSNLVELQAVADPRTGSAVVVGALDNLVKGAAGQAIQNFNIMTGRDEAFGLPLTAVYP